MENDIMEQSIDNRTIPMTSVDSGKLREVKPDIAYYTNQVVNLIMIGKPNSGWVLIDAGMPNSGNEIIKIAEDRFGPDNPPAAIIITHGHFDHVGSIVALLQAWDVPVYAHPLEFPFLTGQQAYPEPDSSVEGGMLAKLAFLYPNKPIDIREALLPLPIDGRILELPDWEWIHVPGHSPGQIALFRNDDRVLISADAFITVKQDALYNVLLQKEEVCGPPVYLTTDWPTAFQSVKRLVALNPEIVISGHGTAMQDEALKEGLNNLIQNWNEIAVPEHGKWVKHNEK
jgi:glyoxylase-like metal-dependent hydrolase (beta-lactamase superfamily II)